MLLRKGNLKAHQHVMSPNKSFYPDSMFDIEMTHTLISLRRTSRLMKRPILRCTYGFQDSKAMLYLTLTMLPVFQSHILLIFLVFSCIRSLLRLIHLLQPRARTTSLKGPARKSVVFRNSKYLKDLPSTAYIYND